MMTSENPSSKIKTPAADAVAPLPLTAGKGSANAFKGKNTKDIFNMLFDSFYGISPDSKVDKKIASAQGKSLDFAGANNRQRIREPIYITATADRAQGMIAELGKNRQTLPLQQGLANAFVGIHAETIERTREREVLEREINEFVKTLHERMPAATRKIIDGATDADVKVILADLVKRNADITARLAKLEINEDSLQRKLNQIVVQTMQAAAVGKGAYQVVPPLSPGL